jgi:hypothetical protein
VNEVNRTGNFPGSITVCDLKGVIVEMIELVFEIPSNPPHFIRDYPILYRSS